MKPNEPPPPGDLARYSRQTKFAPLGEQGQRRLARSTVLLVGCGALGSAAASTLVRAGVGCVRIVDRDFVELSNLQRQVLFDQRDVDQGLPKAIAAAEKLRLVNSQVTIEPVVSDLTHHNLRELAKGVDLIVDGTDNFETRLLMNDYAVCHDTPWVYGGCVGAEGQVLPILPGKTPCLASLVTEPPPPGAAPTCDTAGILGPAATLVASLQSVEAIKILSGALDAVSRRLIVIDLWRNRVRQLNLENMHPPGSCAACHHRRFPWLDGDKSSDTAILCGQDAVQIRPAQPTKVDLQALAARLESVGTVIKNPFLLRLQADGRQITVFADGRAIVGGSDDPVEARSILSRYLGV